MASGAGAGAWLVRWPAARAAASARACEVGKERTFGQVVRMHLTSDGEGYAKLWN